VATARVARMTAATAAFLLPWMLFVSVNGGLMKYFEGGLEFSRIEADATSLSTWPSFALTPIFNGAVDASAWLFWVFWSLPVLCTVMAVYRALRRDERWTGELAVVGGLITMAVFVNAGFMREALEVRVSDAIVPAALLAAWVLGLCWSAGWRRRAVQGAIQFVAVAIVGVTVAAISQVSNLPSQYDHADLGRGLAILRAHSLEVSRQLLGSHRGAATSPSRFATALLPFFEYLDRCSSKTDRLIVIGEGPEIPVMAGRGFAGEGVVFGSSYSSVRNQNVNIARIRAHPPLFVLRIGDHETFRTKFAAVDAYVTSEYEPMADVPVSDAGTIRILIPRRQQSSRIDSATGWPCFKAHA
jgi:hypothetical protein